MVHTFIKQEQVPILFIKLFKVSLVSVCIKQLFNETGILSEVFVFKDRRKKAKKNNTMFSLETQCVFQTLFSNRQQVFN